MRVLVTGGAGFIGSNYVRSLVAGRYESLVGSHVTVLDKLTYSGNRANLDPVAGSELLKFAEGDICDRRLLDQIVPGHDVIVHFAAESRDERSASAAADLTRTNVLGTHAVLDAALRHGVGRVLHVSTDEVYGSIESGSWTEDSPLKPDSPYAASKASSDLIARSFAQTHGLDVVITRCSNNYGPYQSPKRLIPLFVSNLLDGRLVPLYGDGAGRRDWLHVDDHCAGIQLALDAGQLGEIYNIGGTELTNVELTEMLLAACGAGWDQVEHITDRGGHDRRYSIDSSKIRVELGYRPEIAFTDGLAATVDWYRDNRQWCESAKTHPALVS